MDLASLSLGLSIHPSSLPCPTVEDADLDCRLTGGITEGPVALALGLQLFEVSLGLPEREHFLLVVADGVSAIHQSSSTWHEPVNERDYERSPMKAQWRTAKELKMDEYKELRVYKLVSAKGIPANQRFNSLWVHRIKFDAEGRFIKLNPRWCMVGTQMDDPIDPFTNPFLAFSSRALLKSF